MYVCLYVRMYASRSIISMNFQPIPSGLRENTPLIIPKCWFSIEIDRWKIEKMRAQRNISKNRFLSLMSRKINFKLISTGLSVKLIKIHLFSVGHFVLRAIFVKIPAKNGKKVKNEWFSTITWQDLILHKNVKYKSNR